MKLNTKSIEPTQQSDACELRKYPNSNHGEPAVSHLWGLEDCPPPLSCELGVLVSKDAKHALCAHNHRRAKHIRGSGDESNTDVCDLDKSSMQSVIFWECKHHTFTQGLRFCI